MKTNTTLRWKTGFLIPVIALLAGAAYAAQGPQPSICNRSCWGARNGTCTSTIASLSRAMIHHTAGSGDYTTNYETAKARMRTTQNYHMDSNGWCDIGYHFLVSAGGHIFEGRKNAMSGMPRGAHDGCNANSFGFTALGYYHTPYNQALTSAAKNSLEAVIAWRMPSAWSASGSGTYCGVSVGTLDGHYKVKSTACPGSIIINQLASIRSGVTSKKNGSNPPPPPPPPPQVDEADNSALVTDVNGNVWLAAVKTDGTLYTRRYDNAAGVWNSFTSHGTGWSKFAAPALVGQSDGVMCMIAVKSSGAMWSTKWTSGVGWANFSEQGSGGWAVDCGPVAVRRITGEITFAHVKQTRELFHRSYTPATDSWGDFGQHLGPNGGSASWSNEASPCLIAGTDGKLWLFAIDALGGLNHKSWTSSGGWTQLYSNGGGWSTKAGPVGCARPGGNVSVAAVSGDGSLHMRHLDSGVWSGGVHGSAGVWSSECSPAVAYGTDGKLWLFATKDNGQMLHQSWSASGGWSAWYQDGAYMDWSPNVGPSVTARPNGNITWAGTKDTGYLYTRSLVGGSWEDFVLQATGFTN